MDNITKEELESLTHKQAVYFALFCAHQVIHLTDLKEVHECLRVIELWLDGKATDEQCRQAANAVYDAVYSAGVAYATYAAYSAADAAYAISAAYNAIDVARAASYAARATANAAANAINAVDASKNKEICLKQQRAYLHELKNLDKIFEKEFLND